MVEEEDNETDNHPRKWALFLSCSSSPVDSSCWVVECDVKAAGCLTKESVIIVEWGPLLKTPSFSIVRSRSLFKSSDHNIAIVYILLSTPLTAIDCWYATETFLVHSNLVRWVDPLTSFLHLYATPEPTDRKRTHSFLLCAAKRNIAAGFGLWWVGFCDPVDEGHTAGQ